MKKQHFATTAVLILALGIAIPIIGCNGNNSSWTGSSQPYIDSKLVGRWRCKTEIEERNQIKEMDMLSNGNVFFRDVSKYDTHYSKWATEHGRLYIGSPNLGHREPFKYKLTSSSLTLTNDKGTYEYERLKD